MPTMKFKISAGMKDIIGKELITQPNTAIFELVKNSFDANANKVTIVFQNVRDSDKKNNSKILIIDDGDGMSFNDLDTKWLFAGYSDKKITNEEKAEKDFRDKIANHQRVFAGAKGIGRFSADRLGSNFKLYTKEEKKNTIHCLEVDWKEFSNQLEHFTNKTANYSTTNKIPILHKDLDNFEKGTVLEIFPLEDEWDRKKIYKLRYFLQRLINPNQKVGVSNFKIFVDAEEFLDEDKERKKDAKEISKTHSEKLLTNPKYKKRYNKIQQDFREIINGEIENIVFEKLQIKTTQINCKINEDKIITTIIDKGMFVFSVEEENTFKKLAGIEIQIYYLNPQAKATFTKNMGLHPYQYGSVFLYKNGFRIHPLGDPTNDWLQLEAKKGQGYGRNLSRREVIGRVEVNGPHLGIREASSRDGGVISSEEFNSLLEIIQKKVLRWLTRYVVEGIDWDKETKKIKKTDEEIARDSIEIITKLVGQVKDPQKNIKFNPDLLNIFKHKEIENFSKLVKNIKELYSSVKSSSDKKTIEEKLASMTKFTEKMSAGMKSYEDELKYKDEEILFLKKSLAPDTQIIEDFYHHIGLSTGSIETDLKEIFKIISKKGKINEIVPFLDTISIENEKIKSLANLVSKAKFNLQKQTITKDVISFITQYIEEILSHTRKRIRYRFINDHLSFKYTFRPLEITMIFDNFIHNSSKAEASLVKIKFEIKNKSLYIYIGDNGSGIGKKIENRIFVRGVTTTKGSGIGMHNIKTTLEKMGGTINFIGNNYENLGQGACFEVILH